jgi:hypothetical protein
MRVARDLSLLGGSSRELAVAKIQPIGRVAPVGPLFAWQPRPVRFLLIIELLEVPVLWRHYVERLLPNQLTLDALWRRTLI